MTADPNSPEKPSGKSAFTIGPVLGRCSPKPVVRSPGWLKRAGPSWYICRRARTVLAGSAVLLYVLAAATGSATAKDLMDTMIDSGGYCMFLDAVRRAGLEGSLRADGPITVFAPNDASFIGLTDAEIATTLGGSDVTELVATVSRHIVAGAIAAEQIAGKRITMQTISGDYIMLDGTQGRLTIDGSIDVLTTDIVADNGIIHVTRSIIPPYDPES